MHTGFRSSREEAQAGTRWLCELTDRSQVRRMVQAVKPDYVLHLAGRNHVKDSWQDPAANLETNLMGTIYLLEALREAGSRARVLIAGSKLGIPLTEPPNPPHPYSLSKAFQVFAARSWGRLFDLDVMIAHPANLIGPGPSTGICALLAGWIAKEEKGVEQPPFRLSSLAEQRDFLDVRDAVAAFAHMLEHGAQGESYPLVSGSLRTLGELVDGFRPLTRLSLDVIAPAGAFPARTRDTSGASQDGVHAARGNAKPAAAESALLHRLGWRPLIPFHRSLADTLDYFRDREGM
jgi:GDP-4-dehydro-6-deoxy-D-mannose reductase